MREIPEALRKDFAFIKLGKYGGEDGKRGKKPIEGGWTDKAQYKWDDPEIQQHYGNIGISCGATFSGTDFVVIDIDKPEGMQLTKDLPETLTNKTEHGTHFVVYTNKKINQEILKVDGKRVGELQGHKHCIVAPTSLDSKGELSYISNDKPIAFVPWHELKSMLKITAPVTCTSHLHQSPAVVYPPRSDSNSDRDSNSLKEDVTLKEALESSSSSNLYLFEDGVTIIEVKSKFDVDKLKSKSYSFHSRKDYNYFPKKDDILIRGADKYSEHPKVALVGRTDMEMLYCLSLCKARLVVEGIALPKYLAIYKLNNWYRCAPISFELFNDNEGIFRFGDTEEILALLPELRAMLMEKTKRNLHRSKAQKQCKEWIAQIEEGTLTHLGHYERLKLMRYMIRKGEDYAQIEKVFSKLIQKNTPESIQKEYKSVLKYFKGA